jgi:hypothetical protein
MYKHVAEYYYIILFVVYFLLLEIIEAEDQQLKIHQIICI